jgi:hypothetical protein
MSDYVFYFLGIVFFLLLWLYNGGPNNPFSFSGPYITPITDVGSTQVGYDDNSSLHAWHGDSSSGHTDVLDSAKSPLADSVEIVGSSPEERTAGREYLMIRSNASQQVTITGWQLVSSRNGTQVRIPEGTRKSRSGAVWLSQGEKAVIITGTRSSSELKGSFPDIWNVYLGLRSDIWNDQSDTITLLDASGKVVDQYSY